MASSTGSFRFTDRDLR